MIKVADVAHVRFAVPNLDEMESFLRDFGLVRSARTDDTLYMRGTGSDHHIHIAHQGDEPEFIGMAFKAASLAELERFSQMAGASDLEKIEEPGGGSRVCMTDPNGFEIEVVFGIEALAPIEAGFRIGPDHGPGKPRRGDLDRHRSVPCPVKRLGHVVLNVPHVNVVDEFYRNHFGLLSSDEAYLPDGENELALVFHRCDLGKQFVDHHTFLAVKSKQAELAHIAFEVEDVNAVFVGNEFLQSRNYEHSWGIGRHTRGGQVFDYWFDPFGFRVEHFHGGDLLNSETPRNVIPLKGVLESQWGAQPEERRSSLDDRYDPLRD